MSTSTTLPNLGNTGYQNMNTFQIRRMGSTLWKNALNQALGIQQGTIKPESLPEYKGMMEYLTKMMSGNSKNLYQDLAARGVTGGTLGTLMEQNNEGNMSNVLKAIQDFYAKTFGNAGAMGEDAYQTMAQIWMNWQKHLDELAAEKKRQQGQQIMQGIQMLASGVAGGFSGGKSMMGGMGGGGGGGGGLFSSGTPDINSAGINWSLYR